MDPTTSNMPPSSSSSSLHPLITQTIVHTKKYYCPFLERGYCREGVRCNFSHDPQSSIKIPTDYCHFYIANHCLYGIDCKFRHTEPPQPEEASNNIATFYSSSFLTPLSSSTPTFKPAASSLHQAITVTSSSLASNINHHHNHSYSCSSASSSHNQSRDVQDDYDEYNGRNDDCDIDDEHEDDEEEDEDDDDEDDEDEENGDDDDPQNQGNLRKSNDPTTLFALMAIASDMGDSISAVTDPNDPHNIEQQQQQLNCFEMVNYWSEGEYSGNCIMEEQQFLICDLCERNCLDPYDREQQRQHRDDCLKEHEREMETSFAVQRSKDKVCGICMDTVVEKKPITSSRFGILEKCNHIFCLDCIRKWRGTKQFETRTIRACPECRVSSDFVVPSKYWVEEQDDKEKLIHDYKEALRSKPCKYFDEGRGECPFAGSCFYKHAYPDGSIALLGKPTKRKRNFQSSSYPRTVANYILWNILQSQEHDSDNDDWSESDEDLVSLYLDMDTEYELEETDGNSADIDEVDDIQNVEEHDGSVGENDDNQSGY